MEEIEEFSGFSKLSIAKCEQRSQFLSEIIRNLENEIQETENSHGERVSHIIDTVDFSELSESEIELSEDEGAEFLSGDNRGNSLLDEESADELTRVEDLLDDPDSEVEIDDDEVLSNDIVNNCPEIIDDADESDANSYDATDAESNLVVEITPLALSSAETITSDQLVAAVLSDILDAVHKSVEVINEINYKHNNSTEFSDIDIQDDSEQSLRTPPHLPRLEEVKADSIIIGGRTLRARHSSTGSNGNAGGSRSRNSSGGSGRGDTSKAAKRDRHSSSGSTSRDEVRHSSGESSTKDSTSAGVERISRQSSVDSTTKEEELPEADVGVRTLRRRHASNGSTNNLDLAEPPRKTRARHSSGEGRSTRSTSGDVLDRSRHSSGESTPSNVSTPRMSPRSRSPVKAVTGDSVVVNLPKKKKKKDSFDGKARAEADILKRIAELQTLGLWTGKKMVKKDEDKGKYHWDFVLEEMVWLAAVVQQEIKTKKMLAKKCASMIQKHFKDKELAVMRAEKAKEANLRRIALMMSREVKSFWGNVNKLFEYRVKIKLDAKRKEALDQHLNFIVDKTEKYSTLLAESLAENHSVPNSVPNSGAPSRSESVMSGEEEGDNDMEYSPDADSDDDEETIEKEEKEIEEKGNENEINELENEAEVPIEELLKKYYPDQFGNIEVQKKENDEIKTENEEDSKTDNTILEDDTFESTSEEVGRGRRRKKPLNIEEIEARIKAEEDEQALKKAENEAKDDDQSKDEKGSDSDTDGEDKLEEYASMAAKFQPTGNTLDTTTVKTKVPFLLKHTLREYQHIGLDWMVSLFERQLNGILADEMGLGKTIQTIAFLGHLACDRANWGPHLIVVPTSVMLNWEMEIKKWCPAFKVMVYYGSQKERRLKRVGWTKQNAFHICITSYKLVIQDHSSFRRFKWQYLILDEAQHIKNFKSQRWQLLLNFTSVGRLLLTGTPLQNNLMELWSLMHFLMPHVFESHRDFKEWFSNPMSGMVEGNSEYNDSLIKRLHKVLRPFILRRLKNEVEKQLPKKYEHLVKCPLSKRQRFLYDDFMSRAKTRETLNSGNLLSVINVLMQLRKCCNHPNLFEPRPTLSPFIMEPAKPKLPDQAVGVLTYNPLKEVSLDNSPLLIAPLETKISAYTWFRCSTLRCKPSTMLEPPDQPPPFTCPKDKLRFEIRSQAPPVPKIQVVENPSFCQLEQTPVGPVIPVRYLSNQSGWLWQEGVKLKAPQGYFQPAKVRPMEIVSKQEDPDMDEDPCWIPPQDEERSPEKEAIKRKSEENGLQDPYEDLFRHSKGIFSSSLFLNERLSAAPRSPTKNTTKRRKLEAKAREEELEMPSLTKLRDKQTLSRRKLNLMLNDRKTNLIPMYGSELVELVESMSLLPSSATRTRLESLTCRTAFSQLKEEISCYSNSHSPLSLISKIDSVVLRLTPIFSQFLMFVPIVNVPAPPPPPELLSVPIPTTRYPGDFLVSRFQIQTPDTRLIQYDCGKLQILSKLLQTLQAGAHRALIFTQMTKMLDVLEAFLNYHGYVYMRLDGSTKVEMRQCLMERFNNDKKYFIFILSTRSGGVGINLTGADTVIFYDSDWNPTMDAQAQDRCHRIGQTRDVHIYRLVSERTVEENILKKANQKRLLGDIAIEGGNFTTAFFKKSTINDLFDDGNNAAEEEEADEEVGNESQTKTIGAFETALATAEDDTDIQATKEAKAEENEDENDFKEEEDQFNAVLNELSSVERYALRHMEWEEEEYVQEQIEAADAEIEARKEEFDAEKLDELTQEVREELGVSSDEEDEDGEDDGEGEQESEAEVDEYAPDENDSDDEDTIEKDEKQEQKDEFEISMLENEAEVPMEELLKMYYPDQWKQMQGETSADSGTEESGGEGLEGRKKTRSRGNVEINLWALENPEEALRAASVSNAPVTK